MDIKKLKQLGACSSAKEWAIEQKSPAKAWKNCNRGDWMLWIAKRLDVNDKKLTLAKATCVKQIEHLLKDQRSIDALQGCFDYVEGRITRSELNDLAAAAYAVTGSNADAASYTAAYAVTGSNADAASYTASYAAAYAASAAYAAYASAAASAAYAAYAAAYAAAANAATADDDAAARDKSLKKSANICREILTDEVLEKYKSFNI
jgi:hypothetical protein